MKLTVENIIHHLGKTGRGTPRENAAKSLGITPPALSMMKKRGRISVEIALLCHLSDDIPYVFEPIKYGIDAKALNLNLNLKKKHKPQGLKHAQHRNEQAA